MLQTAIRKFRMKKLTKSEANLTKIPESVDAGEPQKPALRVKDCNDLENLGRNDQNEDVDVRSQNYSRQRIVSCPESDDLRCLSKGFDSTIFDLKWICEEGISS
jgi:hypothetical protein